MNGWRVTGMITTGIVFESVVKATQHGNTHD